MAEREIKRIVHDLLSEPHIQGRRISVRQVYTLVEDRGEDSEAVADRYDLDVADVYHALAYYHDHPREMHEVETDRETRSKGSVSRSTVPTASTPTLPEMSAWWFLLDENVDPKTATYFRKRTPHRIRRDGTSIDCSEPVDDEVRRLYERYQAVETNEQCHEIALEIGELDGRRQPK